MSVSHLSNSTVSDAIWEFAKESAINPPVIALSAIFAIVIWVGLTEAMINRKAEVLLKNFTIPSKDIAFLQQAVCKESNAVLWKLFLKMDLVVKKYLKTEPSNIQYNIFQLEMGKEKTTSLMLVCEEGRWEVLDALIKTAASESFFNIKDPQGKRNYCSWIDQQDRFGATALHKIMYFVLARHRTLTGVEKEIIKRSIYKLSCTDGSIKDLMGQTVSNYAKNLESVLPGISQYCKQLLSRSDNIIRKY